MKSNMADLSAKVAKMEEAMEDTEDDKIGIDVQEKLEMLEKL